MVNHFFHVKSLKDGIKDDVDDKTSISSAHSYCQQEPQNKHIMYSRITADNVEQVAWFFMKVDNPIRQRFIKLVGWRWFERIVIVAIVINCIMLALYNPLDQDCVTNQCKVLEIMEVFVFGFFALEMLIKMTAMGIIGRRGYFSDKWNVFDFTIVVAGIVDTVGISGGGFLTIVRLGRILRPLRAINRVPNIRILVSLLMDTIPMLGNVLILAFLVFSCFGILGVQLFQGKLRGRCYVSQEYYNDSSFNRSNYPEYFRPAITVDYVCRLPGSSGTRSCENIPKEYHPKLCEAYYKQYNKYGNKTNSSCLDARRYYRDCRADGPNPYYDSVSFDNIAMAFVFIYQVVTLEGWSDLMYLVQDAYSMWAWIYFVTLISIGSFFLVNLALVVITMQFSDTKRREVKLIKQTKNMASSQLSLYTDLCSMYNWISAQLSCFSHYFRSIHHIHQHVLVHQQPSLLCDQCHRECTPPDIEQPANRKQDISFQIPNIEVSQFEGEPEIPHISKKFSEQRSYSFPGLSPSSLDILCCSSVECSKTNIRERARNTLTYINHHFNQELHNSNATNSSYNICNNKTRSFSSTSNNSTNTHNIPHNSTTNKSRSCSTTSNCSINNHLTSNNNNNNNNNNNSNSNNNLRERCLSPASTISSNRSSVYNNRYSKAYSKYLLPIEPATHGKVPHLDGHNSSHNTLLPGNTISVHTDTSVTVTGCRSPSISSRTSLSLRINSMYHDSNSIYHDTSSIYHDSFEATAYLDAECGGRKSSPRVLHPPTDEEKKARAVSLEHSYCSSRMSSTDSSEYSSSDLGYGSVFDLRHCDKYYVSQTPTRFQKFKLFCKHLSESSRASNGIMLIIVFNTICMAVEHHNEPPKMTQVLETLNLIFIWVFTIEMCVKMFGIGLRSYFNLGFNCFDFVVVMLSIIELLIDSGNGSTTANFTIFRALRLLRIFRLIRPMRHQIAVMLRTTSSVMTFFALLFLFMFTFAILGMNIFGGKFIFKNRFGRVLTSRSNFDSFIWAIVTVFQILTQEDWNLVMYDGIRATNLWASLYFLSLMTVGYYVLFNLLVAILVEGFTTPLEKRRMARHLLSMLKNKSIKKTTLPMMKRTISLPNLLAALKDDIPSKVEEPKESPEKNLSLNRRRRTLGSLNIAGRSKRLTSNGDDSDGSCDDNQPVSSIECAKERPKPNEPVLLSARANRTHGEEPVLQWKSTYNSQSKTSLDHSIPIRDRIYHYYNMMRPRLSSKRDDWSLYLFSIDSRFRRLVIRMTRSKWFDALILVFIIYSCVLLALENPNEEISQKLRIVIDTSMFAMTWVFFCEMMIKVIADGFIYGKGTYLRNGWNILDFLLVVTSVIDIFITVYYAGSNKTHHTEIIKGMRVLRATRALRPLRMIRKAPGLKLVVQTLLYSLKPIGNTVLIAAIFFIVFGILGVQQLKGKFYYCAGVDPYTVENKTECANHPRAYWINYQYNFDNLFEALMLLFVVSTKDGWVDIMRRGIDARGVDLEPRPNHATWRILYFISFLMIGGFLVLNMIVGVVVENFQKCQELQDKQTKTKVVLERWKAQVEESRNNYWRHYPTWRRRIHRICNHPYWDVLVTCVICANVIMMSMEHYQMSHGFHLTLEIANFIFTFLYVVEAVILLVALSPERYFKNRWYCFDMCIVVVSVVGIILENLNVSIFSANPAAIKAMRLLRIVRALKLLKMAKGLRFLLDHVGETIPQVTNLALLFCLLFFVYSCLGMQLFGTLVCSKRYPCAGLGRHANFKTLGSSMLTLFRIATGDNWSGILRDTLRPNCDNSIDCTSNCCVSRYVAPLFFVSFVLFAQFVLVNIVIAVLMRHLKLPEDPKKSSPQKDNKRKQSQTQMARTAFSKWRGNVPQQSKKDGLENNRLSRKISMESRAADCRQNIDNKTSIERRISTESRVYGRQHSVFGGSAIHIDKRSKNIEAWQPLLNKEPVKGNSNAMCNHGNIFCIQARSKLLRKYSCPEKMKFKSLNNGTNGTRINHVQKGSEIMGVYKSNPNKLDVDNGEKEFPSGSSLGNNTESSTVVLRRNRSPSKYGNRKKRKSFLKSIAGRLSPPMLRAHSPSYHRADKNPTARYTLIIPMTEEWNSDEQEPVQTPRFHKSPHVDFNVPLPTSSQYSRNSRNHLSLNLNDSFLSNNEYLDGTRTTLRTPTRPHFDKDYQGIPSIVTVDMSSGVQKNPPEVVLLNPVNGSTIDPISPLVSPSISVFDYDDEGTETRTLINSSSMRAGEKSSYAPSTSGSNSHNIKSIDGHTLETQLCSSAQP